MQKPNSPGGTAVTECSITPDCPVTPPGAGTPNLSYHGSADDAAAESITTECPATQRGASATTAPRGPSYREGNFEFVTDEDGERAMCRFTGRLLTVQSTRTLRALIAASTAAHR